MKIVVFFMLVFLFPFSFAQISSTVKPSMQSGNIVSVINPSALSGVIYQGFLFIPVRHEAIAITEEDISSQIILYKDKEEPVNYTELPMMEKIPSRYLRYIVLFSIMLLLCIFVFFICFAFAKKKQDEGDILG